MVPYYGDPVHRVVATSTGHDDSSELEALDARAALVIGLAATRSYDEARPVHLGEYS